MSQQTAYVVLFEESLKQHLQCKLKDLHVRLWDGADKVISFGRCNLVKVCREVMKKSFKITDEKVYKACLGISKKSANQRDCSYHMSQAATTNGTQQITANFFLFVLSNLTKLHQIRIPQ